MIDTLNVLYLDETKHSSPDEYAFVAGFRGKKEHWDKFLPEWTKALCKKKSLHMNALRWNGKYAEGRVRDLLKRLGPIPYECGLIPVYGGVRVRDYIDLIPRNGLFGRRMAAYYVCLSAVFSLLIETIPGHERLKIVCEAQEEYEPQAKLLFKVFQRLAGQNPLKPYLLSIEFIEKTKLLEPADFLSFALGKWFNEPESFKTQWCLPIDAEKYKSSIPCKPGYWLPRDVARKTVEMIKAEVFRSHRAKLGAHDANEENEAAR